MNSLTWGLDNRIHGAKGHGGTITLMVARDAPPLDLRNRDFSLIRAVIRCGRKAAAEAGLSFDDYGRKFVCTANSAVQFLMYDDRYAGRNPFYAPPRALVDVGLSRARPSIGKSSIASVLKIRGGGCGIDGARKACSPVRHRSRRPI